MSTTTSSFSGLNLLQPTNFRISINRKRMPNITFFAQTVNHPSTSLGITEVPFRRTNTYFAGDKIEFNELTIQALVDKDLKVYTEIHDWMKSLVETNFSTPASTQLDDQDRSEYDIVLSILTNNNVSNKNIRYKSAFPIMLGDMIMNSSAAGIEYIILPITFKFTTFCIEDVI